MTVKQKSQIVTIGQSQWYNDKMTNTQKKNKSFSWNGIIPTQMVVSGSHSLPELPYTAHSQLFFFFSFFFVFWILDKSSRPFWDVYCRLHIGVGVVWFIWFTLQWPSKDKKKKRCCVHTDDINNKNENRSIIVFSNDFNWGIKKDKSYLEGPWSNR